MSTDNNDETSNRYTEALKDEKQYRELQENVLGRKLATGETAPSWVDWVIKDVLTTPPDGTSRRWGNL